MDIKPQMEGNTSSTSHGFTFGDGNSNKPEPESTINNNVVQQSPQNDITDPNQISVTISDQRTPIVVLFGPPACGKTMTLIRLTRYLRTLNLQVEPDYNFRPSSDPHYTDMCSEFSRMIGDGSAAASTERISFMLVKVLDKMGNPLCQILEAPGEHYFNPNDRAEPNVNFPRYVNAIVNNRCRKIWCFMVEPQWKYADQAPHYVAKITKLKKSMRPADKAIFLFNKIDLTPYVYAPGKVNMKQAEQSISDLYKGIFVPFVQKGILWSSKAYKIVPFHTGNYNKLQNGGMSFQEGADEYPSELWNAIYAYVKG